MKLTRQELIDHLAQPLPGEEAHRAFSPFRQVSSEVLKTAEKVRLSAVAIVLFEQFENWYTIVIQRQQYEGTHSGQISFPGGKWEQDDPSLRHTALRECREEIGISEDQLEFIGKLTDVYIPVSTFLIEPYVFIWNNPDETFTLSEREVASVHLLDLSQLVDDQRIVLIDVPMANGLTLPRVPHFDFDDFKIWGATALLLNELKTILIRA